MGAVWSARDPRLNRAVAIKTSNIGFSGRFQIEAQSIAALNHPNICTLYDVGPDYLVMEFIEGPTLADRMLQGPLTLDEALGIARQIADALEAGHEKTIIHRDLKPANIKFAARWHGQGAGFRSGKSGRRNIQRDRRHSDAYDCRHRDGADCGHAGISESGAGARPAC